MDLEDWGCLGLIVVFIGGIVLGGWLTFSSRNLEYVKKRADQTWSAQGFKVKGYQGYMWGLWGYGGYGGAMVCYVLAKEGQHITYKGCLQRWGDEIHSYYVEAIDAIKP